MRTSLWMPLVLLIACVTLAADEPAPAPDAPRSAEAKQASAAYDKAVRDARKTFDAAVEKAQKKYKDDLNKALDKAMQRRDLEEANRIKAAMPSIETPAAPLDVTGRRWLRVSRKDELNNAALRFLPDGRIEAERTGYTKWKREGDDLILMKEKEGVGSRFKLRPELPVFFDENAPLGGSMLIPEN